jgi:hypothetical protein
MFQALGRLFFQKAIWPDLKMRKSLNTHTHSPTHTYALILQESILFLKKKKKQLIYNYKCRSLCEEAATSTADREQEAMKGFSPNMSKFSLHALAMEFYCCFLHDFKSGSREAFSEREGGWVIYLPITAQGCFLKH